MALLASSAFFVFMKERSVQIQLFISRLPQRNCAILNISDCSKDYTVAPQPLWKFHSRYSSLQNWIHVYIYLEM